MLFRGASTLEVLPENRGREVPGPAPPGGG